jgi:polyisoprenoid-binding protein YceI
MFFKLMKELPQMFIIAFVIWGIVLWIFYKNHQKPNGNFIQKHRTTIIALLFALLLTLTDIWLFVSYIPSNFKKNPVADSTQLSPDLLLDSTWKDTTHAISATAVAKDSLKKVDSTLIKEAGKTYITKKASIKFYSKGPGEDIEATNTNVACSFNDKTGALKFTGLIRGFQFENELMQEHFNDKDYMHSELYPKTSFTGKIVLPANFSTEKDGNYNVSVEGPLTIKAVTNNTKVTGTITVTGKTITLKSVFKIKRANFNINIDEVAEELEITVIASFK